MRTSSKHTGFAIALAWPETYCKQPGSWYDSITALLRISRNNYYRAGHAALVLVDSANSKSYYFDFGRYHSPYKQGRVRSAGTDHDLKLNTRPEITADGNVIQNFKEILFELQNNEACHGEGKLHASYNKINFQSAYLQALEIQEQSPIPYGPFILRGSNCSRFVNTVILAGTHRLRFRIRLKYFNYFTPTPINNINSLPHKVSLPVMRKTNPFYPVKRLNRTELGSTLPAPERHPEIPTDAQWLAGEGIGSWFAIEFQKKLLKITRYAPTGSVECCGTFEASNDHLLNPDESFIVAYRSNCEEVVISSGTKNFHFSRVTENLLEEKDVEIDAAFISS